MTKKHPLDYFTPKNCGIAFASFIAFCLFMTSVYTVQEGNRGIVKLNGKATEVSEPGLHFRMPFFESVEMIDVRTRKYSMNMQAATTGKSDDGEIELQMPSTIIVSANWNIPPAKALEIYKSYGGLEQYEDRILDPRVMRITKTVISEYTIEYLISNRQVVTDVITDRLTEALAEHQATMTDVNLESVRFPPAIDKAIKDKQTAKLNAEAEAYNLEQKDLEGQRIVVTAESDAKARTENSIAEAAAIRRLGDAEAHSIRVKAQALAKNKNIVELTKAEKWNGVLPTMMAGGGSSFLINTPTK